MISIHAPLAGCDTLSLPARARGPIFQSTHPLRGATCTKVSEVTLWALFQSTHPLRGATPACCSSAHCHRISIHAPLAGCDIMRGIIQVRLLISIHAPLAGCDFDRVAAKHLILISIHAPLAGCDIPVPATTLLFHVFQSTHPLRGATLCFKSSISSWSYFNPRTPCGVRR